MKKSILSSLLCLVIIAFTACSNESGDDLPEVPKPTLKNAPPGFPWIDIAYVKNSMSNCQVESDNKTFSLSFHSENAFTLPLKYPNSDQNYWDLNGQDVRIELNSEVNLLQNAYAVVIKNKIEYSDGVSTNLCNIVERGPNGSTILGNIHTGAWDGYAYWRWHEAADSEMITDIGTDQNIVLMADRQTNMLYAGVTSSADRDAIIALSEEIDRDGFPWYFVPVCAFSPDKELVVTLGGMGDPIYNSLVPQVGTTLTSVGEVEVYWNKPWNGNVYNVDIVKVRNTIESTQTYDNKVYGYDNSFNLSFHSSSPYTVPLVVNTYERRFRNYWELGGQNVSIKLNSDYNILQNAYAVVINYFRPINAGVKTNICNIVEESFYGPRILGNIYLGEEDDYPYMRWYSDREPEMINDTSNGHYYIILYPDRQNNKLYVGVVDSWVHDDLRELFYDIEENGFPWFFRPLCSFYSHFDWHITLGGMDDYQPLVPYVGTSHTSLGTVEVYWDNPARSW